MLGGDKGHPSSLNSPNLYRGSRLQVVHVMDSTSAEDSPLVGRENHKAKAQLHCLKCNSEVVAAQYTTLPKKKNNVLEQTSAPVNRPSTPHRFRLSNYRPAESFTSAVTELSSH